VGNPSTGYVRDPVSGDLHKGAKVEALDGAALWRLL
jgi:hypothetical protein